MKFLVKPHLAFATGTASKLFVAATVTQLIGALNLD